jgi:hypothetical protein
MMNTNSSITTLPTREAGTPWGEST